MTLLELMQTDPAWDPDPGVYTDAQALAWATGTETVQGDVPWTDYMLWLSETNGVSKLRSAISGGGADSVKNAAELALIVAQAGQALSVSRGDVRNALTPLLTGGVFTVEEKDALLAKGQQSVPRWKLPAHQPLVLTDGRRLPDGPGLAHVAAERAV